MKFFLMRVLFYALLFVPLLSGAQGFIDIVRVDATRGIMGKDYEQLSAFNTTVQLPILLSSGDAILTGFAIEAADVESTFSSYKGRVLMLNLGANINVKPDQPLTVLTFQRMSSDAFQFRGDAYQFGLAALYTYKKTENNTLRLGFYGNTEFMGPIVTPLFGLDWEIGPRLRFYGVLPANGTIAYQQSENWFMGLNFIGTFQTYQQPGDGDFYLQRAVNLLSLYSDYYLTKNIVFNAKLGFMIGSGFKRFETGDKIDWALNLIKFGDDRTELDRISIDGFVARAGLIFRFSLEDQ